MNETDLQVREVNTGPWSGGLSIRPWDSFPRWNLIVAKDGSTRIFYEEHEGKIGAPIVETFPIDVFKPEKYNGYQTGRSMLPGEKLIEQLAKQCGECPTTLTENEIRVLGSYLLGYFKGREKGGRVC